VPGAHEGERHAGGFGIVIGAHFPPVVFDDLNFERRDYSPWATHGQSKTANILFAVALDESGKKDGVRGSHSIRGAYPALASKSISRLRNSGPSESSTRKTNRSTILERSASSIAFDQLLSLSRTRLADGESQS
jgi:hypothetical protein